ncbi:glycosyltransferase family 8 protein [Siculibacillus lacustris]|nr:glycosyltransferase family 8 protein [Siculibacillus lacustris]
MKFKLCCATDENYTQMTSVMIVSALANSREDISEIHVFCHRLAPASLDLLRQLAPDLVHIHDHRRIPPMIAAVPLAVRPSAAMWMRVMAPDVIPVSDERIVYLDCDAVVDRRLDALTRLDLEGRVVAAVEDFAKAKHAGWNERLGLPLDTPYFNSGVLVIDHRRYVEEGWSQRITDISREMPDKLVRVDQDAFNIACARAGGWTKLDPTYNAHASSARTKRGGVAEVFAGAHVIHFVGRRKPTDVDCTHAAKDVFLRYRAMSPYADVPLRGVMAREVYNRLRATWEAIRLAAWTVTAPVIRRLRG